MIKIMDREDRILDQHSYSETHSSFTDSCLFLPTAGDVSPISMSPISQSQFIPLGEVLCLAISAMNSARKPVTQEALTEHLATCFPGNNNTTSVSICYSEHQKCLFC